MGRRTRADQRRSENYGELCKPLDPAVFIHDLRSEMTATLDALNTAVPDLDWLDVTDRAAGAITLSKYEAAPEPRNLRRIKAEVLAERLMLAICAYGTNTGIRAVAAGGGHGHTEDEVRYVHRRYLTLDTSHGGRDRYRQRDVRRSPADAVG